MISFLIAISEIFALFVVCGLGSWLCVTGGINCSGLARLAACATLGLGALGVAATIVFYAGWPCWYTVALALIASGCGALFALSRDRNEIVLELGRVASGFTRDFDVGIGLILLLCVIFAAGYRGNFHQPFRIGIDEVGYSVAADYLARGGTKSQLEGAIMHETGQPNLEYALNANVTTLSFNDDVAGEFLLKAYRFSYPMVLAAVTSVLNFQPLVNYQFCLLAVPLGCAALLILWFCHDLIKLPLPAAKVMALAFAANCNQLNVLFEGQHAQIAVAPFLVIFFAMLYELRSHGFSGAVRSPGKKFMFLALSSAGIFALYSDSFIALGTFGVTLLTWDFLCRDWSAVRSTLVFAAGVTFGMMLVGLYFLEWGAFLLRHLGNLGAGNGGFWQPHWAMPNEIIGYLSIYDKLAPQLFERSPVNISVGLSMSVLIFAVALTSRFWKTAAEFRFWMVPVIVCTFVYFNLRVWHHFHNYGYMKTYVLLLVPLGVCHLGTLYSWLRRAFHPPKNEVFAVLGTAAAAAGIMFTGLSDSVKYLRTAQQPSPDAVVLRALQAKLDLRSYAILTYPLGGIKCAILGAFIDFNWLNLAWADKKVEPGKTKKVLLLVFRDDYSHFSELAQRKDVLFLGDDIALINTGVAVNSLGLPEMPVIADKLTTAIRWPTAQLQPLTDFIDRELSIDGPGLPGKSG